MTGQVCVSSAGVVDVPSPMGSVAKDYIRNVYRDQYYNRLKAKYDAAQTTPENEIHWSQTDWLSADAANNPAVRKKLRERSRYEAENSSFYAGALETDANAMVGPGPSKRFFFGDDVVDSQARELYRRHARRVHLAQKLRQLRKAKMRDGEAIAVRFNNDRFPADGPQLDMALVECDRLAAPYDYRQEPNNIDGVIVDRNGVPVRYQILDRHPGDTDAWRQGEFGAYRLLDAADVIHYFHQTRPGQHRGIPAVTPCLNLFAQYRRFKLAVLTAAETAANVAAMLKLDATIVNDALAGNGLGGVVVEDDELFEIVRGAIPALPPGYSLEQLKAEQPTTTLDMFERTILREIGRCFGQTFSVMAGDSSQENMSSGNLGERRWWMYLESERSDIDEGPLEQYTGWWWEEQRRIPSSRSGQSLPLAARSVDEPASRTTWSTRFEHNDPAKVAQADAVYHGLGLLTDDQFLEQRNINPTEHYQELERQVARRKALGLAVVGETTQPSQRETDGGRDAPNT